MKSVALLVAFGSLAVAGNVQAQAAIRFDTFGQCIAARHQVLADMSQQNKDSLKGYDRWLPGVHCERGSDGYFYLYWE